MCNLSEGIYEEAWNKAWDTSKAEMTANMLKENAPMDFISLVTDLPIDKITEIGKLRGLL